MTVDLADAALLLGASATIAAYVAREAARKTDRRLGRLETFVKASIRGQAVLSDGYAQFLKRWEPEVYKEVVLGEGPPGKGK